jgi:winged helix-turn-helix protein
MREPNPDKLNELMGKLVGDLGAAIAGASVLLGDRLGLYKAMADGAPVTSSELAKKTGLHERYVREWLSGQAAPTVYRHARARELHLDCAVRSRSPHR